MLRRKLYLTLSIVGMLAFATLAARAQVAMTGGRVVGPNKEVVAGATVEMYGSNGKAARSPVKTDKRGIFTFVGVPFGDVYTLSFSAPGYAPMILPNIKAGMENVDIALSVGDGKKLTADEVKAALAARPAATGGAPASEELTAEQKKQQAEFEAKKKEIEAKNEREKNAYENVIKSLTDGQAADKAGDYDTAIAKFNEGYLADPENPGRAPVLLNNLGLAYQKRAVVRYKKIPADDIQAKIAAQDLVKKDFADALSAFSKAWTVANMPGGQATDPKNLEMSRTSAVNLAADTVRYMAQTRLADAAAFAPAETLVAEFQKSQNDPEKKVAALLLLPDMYMAAGEAEKAIAGYRKVIEVAPDNVEALAGLGLELFTQGSVTGDKAMLQEGADVLARFVAKAPDTHKYKADVVAVLAELKNQQIAPAKAAGGGKKKGN